MPPVVAAAAAHAAGAAFSSVVLTFFVELAISVGLTLAISAVGSSLFGKRRPGIGIGEAGLPAQATARAQVIRSAVQPMRLVYGEVMVSGPLVFAETTGANKEFFHMVVPLCAREAEMIAMHRPVDEIR